MLESGCIPHDQAPSSYLICHDFVRVWQLLPLLLDMSTIIPPGEPHEFRELSASFSVKISASSPRVISKLIIQLLLSLQIFT